MLTLIKNAHVFSPRDLGICDVLISDTKIVSIEAEIKIDGLKNITNIVDVDSAILTPGFVDTLVHITGGGGEGGFGTRTPELNVKEAITAGVTTLVGALGTDACTRSLRDLYGKTQQLNSDGLSCYMYTGSYEVPVKTLMGSIKDDLVFIDPIIGVGEIAISDHRGSQPTATELARIGAEAKVGGMISGKKGIVMIHVGEGDSLLQPIYDACNATETRISQFYPTHINRNQRLLNEGIKFCKQGGTIDFTASTTEEIIRLGELRASKALANALEQGAPIERITISSDAQGSLPHFDSNGNLDGLNIGRINSLLFELQLAVNEENIPFSSALSTITKNPADTMGLYHKGRIKIGADADFNLLTPQTLEIKSVMAKGHWLLSEGKIVKKTAFDHE